MAEIALGGFQVAVKRSRPDMCGHEQTLTTVTCGLQRIVCEMCGNVRLRYIRPLAGPIDRNRFARPADDGSTDEIDLVGVDGTIDLGALAQTPAPVFAPLESVSLRSRI